MTLTRSRTPRVRRRVVAMVALCVAVAFGSAGCSAAAAKPPTSTAHPVTSTQAQRLATIGVNAYRAKTLAVSGTVVSGADKVALDGWINTVDRIGYALAKPAAGGGFLTVWNSSQVSAQDSSATKPPLPRPQTGWSTTALSGQDSALATAQLVLLGIGQDRPENPQLLLQNGAKWLKSATIDNKKVDVMSGPLAEGATVSNLRYWVDHSGTLLRLQARLGGQDWSTFDLHAVSGVSF